MRPRHVIFAFKCGDDCIQNCSDYKYLGLVLNEFLDYNITAKSVALSANRALGLVIAKCKIFGGVSHGVFTKLYDSMVSSIVEYGASIWGTRNYSCINAIQNRACRVLTKMFFVHVSTCKWRDSLNADISRSGRGGNKLRTYRLFKDRFETENYCKIPLPFTTH
jgi:hypothetical protein